MTLLDAMWMWHANKHEVHATVRSSIIFSGIPAAKSSGAPVALRPWFVFHPVIPASLHISFNIVLSEFLSIGTGANHGFFGSTGMAGSG